MKIRHHVPNKALEPRSATVDEAYQREVDRTMAHAEAEYGRAQKRLRAAERRLARAQAADQSRKQKRLIEQLEILVELRREEMQRTHRLMAASRYPATNRGRDSYRNVPHPGDPL